MVDRIKKIVYEKIRAGSPIYQYDIFDLDELTWEEKYMLCLQATNLSARECWTLFGSKAKIEEPPIF